MAITKEERIKFFKAGELGEKGKDRLIEALLNPQKEELQRQLEEIMKEDMSCLIDVCETRERMKGHPINCKKKGCPLRLSTRNPDNTEVK